MTPCATCQARAEHRLRPCEGCPMPARALDQRDYCLDCGAVVPPTSPSRAAEALRLACHLEDDAA